VLERVLDAHVLRATADDDAELDLPVRLLRPARDPPRRRVLGSALVAFMKITGSLGTCAPVSFAWSA
jgi:hypothetical protein